MLLFKISHKNTSGDSVSDVGAEGAGSKRAPPKVLVCQKFGHRNFDIF